LATECTREGLRRLYRSASLRIIVCRPLAAKIIASNAIVSAHKTTQSLYVKRSGQVRIGISGWRYAPWRGVFYPRGLKHRDELNYASHAFPTVEINGTFYSLQSPRSFAQWAEQTPDQFVFAVKGSRYITHLLRLNRIRIPLANFFASGVLQLGAKLGPILWQFPPNFRCDLKRMESFLKLLPRDTSAAAELARKHDKRVKQKSFALVGGNRQIRHAFEVRHPSFGTAEFVQLLRAYDVALVCADSVEWPRWMDLTSDFVYCRLHGSEVLYASGYDDAALVKWADRIAAWAQGNEPRDAEKIIPKLAPKKPARDVFIYFDNDAKVRAPVDASRLIQRLRRMLPEASVQTADRSRSYDSPDVLRKMPVNLRLRSSR
jgi:uncharacterized protein YecE (DUF72 family)